MELISKDGIVYTRTETVIDVKAIENELDVMVA